MNSAVVLLSGGLDSLVSLAEALRRRYKVFAITFDYGQRAAKREIEASRKITKFYTVKHSVVKLGWLKDISSTPLVNKSGKIPGSGVSPEKGADRVWVPNRNGAMINIAASFAEALGYKEIVIGTNAEEGRFFPDNTEDFISAVNRSLFYSTKGRVKAASFTGKLKKREILRMGFMLKAPLKYLWSCYKGGRELCLDCHSCGYLVRSLREEGLWDIFWDRRKKVRWS